MKTSYQYILGYTLMYELEIIWSSSCPGGGPGFQMPPLAPSLHQQIELRLYAIMFFSIDYTRLCTIISDYTRLFYYKNSNDYTRLFHYLTKDDYFTYFTTIISLIFFGTYYCDYCDYTRLCALVLLQAIICIILFEMN